jgi:tetratricopeptide (TPR) repeat protein
LADAHTNLGNALDDQGKLAEAIAEFREAIRLQPNLTDVHINLGNALRGQGKPEEAIAEFREAIRLQPNHPWAHYNLGNALRAEGKLAQAIAEFREAIRLQPNHPWAHNNLGNALRAEGKLAQAIAEYREAIRLQPNLFVAHTNLGNALDNQGKLAEAIAEFREAIRLQPHRAEVHCNLGQLLQRQGQFTEALAEYKRGHALGTKRTDWRYPSAEWVRNCERMVAIDAKLPAILKGEVQPADVAERLTIAQICYNQKRNAASARFWNEAFQADGKLADDMPAGNRYNAACSAALAGCGPSKDEPPPSEVARARLRQQALDWLKADLAYWTKQVETGLPQAKAFVNQTLQHWKTDPDLAGIREATALAKLPAGEPNACRALWSEVDALLARTGGLPPP